MQTETTDKLTMRQVREKIFTDAAQSAAGHFAKHEIVQTFGTIGDKVAIWRCQQPGQWAYGFFVAIRPGSLTVEGDIGYCTWQREPDMLKWARQSVNDPRYMAEKVPQAIPTTDAFVPQLASAWLAEEEQSRAGELEDAVESSNEADIEKCRKRLLDWQETMHTLEQALQDSDHEFFEAMTDCCDAPHITDVPSFRAFNQNFLSCLEALRWFLVHLPATQEAGWEAEH